MAGLFEHKIVKNLTYEELYPNGGPPLYFDVVSKKYQGPTCLQRDGSYWAFSKKADLTKLGRAVVTGLSSIIMAGVTYASYLGSASLIFLLHGNTFC